MKIHRTLSICLFLLLGGMGLQAQPLALLDTIAANNLGLRSLRAGVKATGEEARASLRLPDPEAAMKKGIEICEAFRTFIPPDSIPSACSGGIILCGEDESLSAELIERADRALYRAKRENKGGCCLWSAETDG